MTCFEATYPGHAKLLAGTEYETVVQPLRDTLYLVIYPGPVTASFHLNAGLALAVDPPGNLRRPRIEQGENILGALPEFYRGNDRDKLLAFLAEHADMSNVKENELESDSIMPSDVEEESTP